MELIRRFTSDEIARAFVALGGEERIQKAAHRAIAMPNGHLVVIPEGDLATGLIEKLFATAEVTAEDVERALS